MESIPYRNLIINAYIPKLKLENLLEEKSVKFHSMRNSI